MFYTAAYAAMNVGAFAVVSHFANAGEKYVTLEDYAGLGRQSPAAGRDSHHLPAVPDRHSDHGRFFCEVLRVLAPRCIRIWSGLTHYSGAE